MFGFVLVANIHICMGAYKKLTVDEKKRAVAEVNADLTSMKAISKSYSIGYSSLKLLVAKSREGQSLDCQRPGPPPR